jgi:hypothetical protein
MRTADGVARKLFSVVGGAGFLVLALAGPVWAGWFDWLKQETTSGAVSNQAPMTASLPVDQIATGLKEALAKGAEKSITNLRQQDGFFTNLAVRIPMPQGLADIEKGLRVVGKEQYADDFVLSMNRAAESAMAEAGPIVGDAIRNMTVEDARKILNGPDDAATQYLQKVGGAKLTERMLPIVKAATEKVGVTAAYKNLISKAGFVTSFMQQKDLDIDQYVTGKAVDGLFKMIAVEEKEIRKNPVARTTDLLKKVFGAAGK